MMARAPMDRGILGQQWIADQIDRANGRSTRMLTDAEMRAIREQPPRYAGLRDGDAVGRWIDRQPPIDRALFWLVIVALVVGVAVLAVLLMGGR